MEIAIPIEDSSKLRALYGNTDRNLRLIRDAFEVRISARNNTVRISGPAKGVARAAHVVETLQRCLRDRSDLTDELVRETIDSARDDDREQHGGALNVFLPGTTIAPKGEGQRRYVEAMHQDDLTFCLGPAGTGKTYLAVAVAVSLLKQNMIHRIVLVRPAVEAGEKLGYLPGDMQAKVNPYLRPLFDAMHDMMTFDQIKRFLQNDIIEVVPLAFMRGRTLNGAAIILDEAQNATVAQMLMFLTRLGHDSKMVVTGDDSQSDLTSGQESGLTDAVHRLSGIRGVSVVRLSSRDIVRHALVQRVVEAYGQNEEGVL